MPVLQKIKIAYLEWYAFYHKLPKIHRHSLGQRIDNLFVLIIETVATAGFLKPEEKQPYVRRAITLTDTLKIMLMILWETKSLTNKEFLVISVKIDAIGRMLGGWNGKLIAQKQNSPIIKRGEK